MTPTIVWAHSLKKVGVLNSEEFLIDRGGCLPERRKIMMPVGFANGKYTDPH